MDLSTISLVLVVAIVVSLVKPFLELAIKPANALHDTMIRLMAIVVGLIFAGIDYGVHGGSWGQGALVEATAGRGLVAGVGAVLTYHLLTSSVWDTLGGSSTTVTVTNPPPAPPTPPAQVSVSQTPAAPAPTPLVMPGPVLATTAPAPSVVVIPTTTPPPPTA